MESVASDRSHVKAVVPLISAGLTRQSYREYLKAVGQGKLLYPFSFCSSVICFCTCEAVQAASCNGMNCSYKGGIFGDKRGQQNRMYYI